jgi:hypothetical protein
MHLTAGGNVRNGTNSGHALRRSPQSLGSGSPARRGYSRGSAESARDWASSRRSMWCQRISRQRSAPIGPESQPAPRTGSCEFGTRAGELRSDRPRDPKRRVSRNLGSASPSSDDVPGLVQALAEADRPGVRAGQPFGICDAASVRPVGAVRPLPSCRLLRPKSLRGPTAVWPGFAPADSRVGRPNSPVTTLVPVTAPVMMMTASTRSPRNPSAERDAVPAPLAPRAARLSSVAQPFG